MLTIKVKDFLFSKTFDPVIGSIDPIEGSTYVIDNSKIKTTIVFIELKFIK